MLPKHLQLHYTHRHPATEDELVVYADSSWTDCSLVYWNFSMMVPLRSYQSLLAVFETPRPPKEKSDKSQNSTDSKCSPVLKRSDWDSMTFLDASWNWWLLLPSLA